MPGKYLEENRFLFIQSSLGPNELLLESFSGSEGISRIFSFQLELLSENRKIRFEDVLGRDISFGVRGAEEGDEPRYIHGIVTAFSQKPDTERLARYSATVSPRLWILTQKYNCRIFQNMTVPDILKDVFAGLDLAWELRGKYVKKDYCVQYRETDLNFASRLMEEEGIFYFFRHARDSHKLVIADSKSSHQDIPGDASLIYDDLGGGLREEARISGWAKTQELGPGKYSLQDYCFETPTTNLYAFQDILPSTAVGKVTHKLKVGGNERFVVYDYPGRYEKKPDGDERVHHAMEQLEMAQITIRGEGNAFSLIPGYRFTLNRHPNADGSYVVTFLSHSASEGGFHSGSEIGDNHYSNFFEVMPFSLSYRPRPSTVKPQVRGCQTAVVVGPAGEEIYTDKYGRVKVQFHWDREGQKNDSSSCWIRVGTHWAGKQWGGLHIPRIGQEVIVDFLEGDPDRPIIVGSVYNANNMPPVSLPADRTQSGLVSQTSPGGGGYNQILFEDLAGKEDIRIHAQYDMNETVEHDRTTDILHDDTLRISRHRTTSIGGNRTTAVSGNCKTDVGEKSTLTAGKEIVLETGQAKMVMKATGEIEITGLQITIKGDIILSEARATNTIKGGLVMLNP